MKAAEETEFLKGFSGRKLSKRARDDRQQRRDSGGTSALKVGALYGGFRGSGNREKIQIRIGKQGEGSKWGENSGKNQCQTQKQGRRTNAWNVSG